ncbi:MAG: class I SAM-dependent methyltransferase [Solirubrobacteraceae bacterium]|nr:class I SAM-dependent methyltransferase [Solirubrobacteraceae bacterium]
MSTDTTDDDSRLARLSTRDDPYVEQDEAAELPLLLHSMGVLRELFGDLVAAVRPTTVVEIGGEGGLLTRELLAHAEALDARVLCVDSAPSAALVELADTTRLELVRAFSPAAIDELPERAEFVVVDGDHNYAVVVEETRRLLARADAAGFPPFVAFHDVCFPWARRDLYYDPSAVDPAGVHAHRFDTGVSVFSHDPIPGGGMRSRGNYAIADHAGGERNGVRTAIEDAIADRDDLVLRIVPAVFGLGFLYPKDAPWAPAVDALLQPLDRSPLLARLERNRLALYMKLLELQDHGHALARAYDEDRARFEARYAEVSGENLRLREELAALKDAGRSGASPVPTAGGPA